MAEDLEYLGRIAGLIIKYRRGELSEEESLELTVWCAQSTKNQELFDQLSNPAFVKENIKALPDIQSLKQSGGEKVVSAVDGADEAVRHGGWRRLGWRRYFIVVFGIGVAMMGCWLYYRQQQQQKAMLAAIAGTAVVRSAEDVAPGGSKAVLTLSDGSLVALDSTGSGTISQQKGATVMKSPGVVSYAANISTEGAGDTAFNTLTTPSSGQYQVVLPDGSRVWLNNLSSLRYPIRFSGAVREVELEGEAFFDVAKNITQPFVVHSGSLSVRVIGTSFNVSAFSKDTSRTVTLVTGGVRVDRDSVQMTLQTGEQAVAVEGGGLLLLKAIHTEAATAWKNGVFHFDSTDLRTVMKVLARWYDVEVVYEGPAPDLCFGGDYPRSLTLRQILEMLGKDQLHFELKGRMLILRS